MKLKDVAVVFICPDHNERYTARKEHMFSLLKRVGFTNVRHFKSSTENYPECLNNATIQILEEYFDEPVLVLEDDVECMEGSLALLEEEVLVSDVDAVYLGLSKSAGHPTENSHEGLFQYEAYDSGGKYVRVLNMLGGHAILYISQAYKLSVIHSLLKHKNQNYHHDVLLSRLQSNNLVLAYKRPLFYQAARFNACDHSERWTKFEIE
jgi:hypothetical protein